MDVGTTLRTAREQHHLSLVQLAATTKIPIGLLRALEENAFDKVPPGIFVRGYIRAYAREVGLDPEEMVAQFLAETVWTAAPAAGDSQSTGQTLDDDIEPLQIDPDLSESSRAGWGYVLIVAALLVGVISFNRGGADDEAIANGAPVDAAAETAPLDATVAVDAIQPVATTGDGVRLEMQAQGPCWVEAVVDGKTLVYRLMQPGEREVIDALSEIVLRVGDPGAFTYSINGTPGQPLGKPGIPVRVRLTGNGERVDLIS